MLATFRHFLSTSNITVNETDIFFIHLVYIWTNWGGKRINTDEEKIIIKWDNEAWSSQEAVYFSELLKHLSHSFNKLLRETGPAFCFLWWFFFFNQLRGCNIQNIQFSAALWHTSYIWPNPPQSSKGTLDSMILMENILIGMIA